LRRCWYLQCLMNNNATSLFNSWQHLSCSFRTETVPICFQLPLLSQSNNGPGSSYDCHNKINLKKCRIWYDFRGCSKNETFSFRNLTDGSVIKHIEFRCFKNKEYILMVIDGDKKMTGSFTNSINSRWLFIQYQKKCWIIFYFFVWMRTKKF